MFFPKISTYSGEPIGDVYFVSGKTIKKGRIFGRPHTKNLLIGPQFYYIVVENQVYEVEKAAIMPAKEWEL